MKKQIFFIAMMLLLPLAASAGYTATNVEIGGIYYNLNVITQVAEVTDHPHHYTGDVVIPKTVEYEGVTYHVTTVKGFSYCEDLHSVTIAEGVTTIGAYAFHNSTLNSVTIPNSVTSIGERAFFYCSALTSIAIPKSVSSIGSEAFMHCGGLTSITVESGNENYDSRNDCNAIIETASKTLIYGCKSTIIPSGITSIAKSAFHECNGLESIVIPEGLTTIGEQAFYYCKDLKSVTIPSSVTSIGTEAFAGCYFNSVTVNWQEPFPLSEGIFSSNYSLETQYYANLFVPKGSKDAYSKADYWKCFARIIETDPNAIFFEDQNVEAICLENWDTDGDGLLSKDEAAAVTSLGGVFNRQYIDSFNELKYFTGLTSIEDEAFNYSTLKSVTLPPNVKSIGRLAFSCGIESIVIPDGVTSIGNSAFGGCTDLLSITIPNSVTSIGSEAFFNCCKLTSITIPSNVTSIEYATFKYCEKLSSVTIPEGVISIEMDAFWGCRSLESIIIPCSVTNIKDNPFVGCSLASIVVKEGNNTYDSREGCNAIIRKSDNTLIVGCKNTIIPSSVRSVQGFEGCVGLKAITIPEGVISVGSFTRCSGLESITFPNSLKSIGAYAFSNCTSLKSIAIPSGVTDIGMAAFWTCSSLSSIVVDEGNTVFDSRDGCNAIIRKSDNTLIAGCKNTKIPSSVNSIEMAFFGCMEMKSITIPYGVTMIDELSFDDCYGLTSVTIANSVTGIEFAAFANCRSLPSITIPNSVNSIGEDVFANCYALTSVIVDRQNPFTISPSSFPTRANIILYVPKGCKEAYAGADCWKEFKEIKEFVKKESTTYAVEENNTLSVGVVDQTDKEVEIPESVNVDGKDLAVKAIADNAFVGNTVIKKVSIPESVEEIGESAFAECTNLRAIYSNAAEPIDLSSGKATVRTRAEGEEVAASNVFTNVDKRKCILYVPLASIAKYKAAKGWGEFQHIVGIGDLLPGDANGNTKVEPTDIDAVRDFILTDKEPEDFKYQNADADGDGDVNAADIVNIVNIIKNKAQ